ncbi:hypothetical protein DIURU_004624 [Diutina rugosa]|uniref:Uncharacterized protein n=1 Tax=Diutina rugosa TaxID=5481 RepID=A0A642UGP9_DIURU|nr:uncharacterized protein DIURU_004624 [Diutina rugosa]KAA8898604.1 hypothetical protein DIURU_004624 [Diutina rugosa]
MSKEEGTNLGTVFWPLLASNVFSDELKTRACKEVTAYYNSYLKSPHPENLVEFFEGATVLKDLQLSEKLAKQVLLVVLLCPLNKGKEQPREEIATWVLRQPQSLAEVIKEVITTFYDEDRAVLKRVIHREASRIPSPIMHSILKSIANDANLKYNGFDEIYTRKEISHFTDLLIAASGNSRIGVEMLVNHYADDLGQPTVKTVLELLATKLPVIPEQPITHAEALVDVSATASPSNSNTVEAIEGQSSTSTDTVVHRAGSKTKKRRAPVPVGKMKKSARPNSEK